MLEGNNIQKLDVSGDIVYIAAGYVGIVCVNVSDLWNPEYLGKYECDARDVEIHGDVAFIAGLYDGLVCVNVSDPVNPTFISKSSQMTSYASIVRVKGDTAYLVDHHESIRTINVTNPKTINFLDNLPIEGIRYIDLSSNALYCTSTSEDVHFVDINDPQNLVYMGNYSGVSDTSIGVKQDNGIVFYGPWSNHPGIMIMLDVRNPNNPELLYSYYAPTSNPVDEFVIIGDIVYVHYANNVLILKIRNYEWDYVVPPVLNELTLVPGTVGNISIDWEDVSGAHSYNLYKDTTPITSIHNLTPIYSTLNITEFEDEVFVDNTYYYAVTTLRYGAESNISNVESLYVDLPSPQAPILNSITPDPDHDGIIYLDWNDVPLTDNYTILRSTHLITEIDHYVTVIDLVTVSEYIDTIYRDDTYYYAIYGTNSTGDSLVSNCHSVLVDLPEPEAPELDPISPNPDTDGNVLLNWNEITGLDESDFIIYNVYRDTTPIVDVDGREYYVQTPYDHYADTGLENGVYYYAVTAVGNGGESLPSNGQEVIVQIPKERNVPGFKVGIILGLIGICSIILVRAKKVSEK